MKKTKPQIQSFDESLTRLETISRELELGDLSLEDSLELFEEGMLLSRQCVKKLEEAEKKIEILQKGGDAAVKAIPVKVNPETGEIEDDGELQGSLL